MCMCTQHNLNVSIHFAGSAKLQNLMGTSIPHQKFLQHAI